MLPCDKAAYSYSIHRKIKSCYMFNHFEVCDRSAA